MTDKRLDNGGAKREGNSSLIFSIDGWSLFEEIKPEWRGGKLLFIEDAKGIYRSMGRAALHDAAHNKFATGDRDKYVLWVKNMPTNFRLAVKFWAETNRYNKEYR